MGPHSEEPAHFAVFVQKDGKGIRMFFQKFFYRFRTFLCIHAVNLQASGAVQGIEFFERRTFFPANGSPSGPKIDENDVAGPIFKIYLVSVQVFDGKIRGQGRLGV